MVFGCNYSHYSSQAVKAGSDRESCTSVFDQFATEQLKACAFFHLAVDENERLCVIHSPNSVVQCTHSGPLTTNFCCHFESTAYAERTRARAKHTYRS